MHNEHELKSKIRGYIETKLARDRRDVDLDTESLVESGIIDSLGILKLVEFLEKELGVKIPDEELLPEDFDTVETITALVAKKLAR